MGLAEISNTTSPASRPAIRAGPTNDDPTLGIGAAEGLRKAETAHRRLR